MENQNPTLSYFDRVMGRLHGLPDVVSTKATTLRVVPLLGIGSHTYIVQTFRQKDEGDSIFLEQVAEGETKRIIIPAAVAETIARQRDQLTFKSRSRAGVRRAEEMKSKGILPGFMYNKKSQPSVSLIRP